MNETFGQTNSADVYLYYNNSECSKKYTTIRQFMAFSIPYIHVVIFNGNSSDNSEMDSLSGTEACSNESHRLLCGLTDEECGQCSECVV